MTTDNRINRLEFLIRMLKQVACLFCGVFAAGLFVADSSAQAEPAHIQKIIDDRVKARLAPAIVVGIVRKDGSKEFYSAGKLKAGATKKVDENTIFEIASISKVFTTLLMAQMEEQGDLKFSDHAQSFLPAGVTMPVKEGIPNRSGETPITHITLEHLATHTSGLPKMPGNFHPKDPFNPYADYTFQQMYDFLSSCDLKGEIGRPVYSNLGMGLLGHILELKAGKSYEELLIVRICEPLGMISTTTKPRPQDAARVAGAHVGTTPVSAWDIPTLTGCGDINSTVKDMLIFAAANMGQIDTPLAKTMRRCHAPRVTSVNNLGNVPQSPMIIRLGWHAQGRPGREIIFHNGGTGGFASFMGFRPDTGEGMVILSNSNYRGVDHIGFHLLDDGRKLDKFQKLVKIDPGILSDYLGTYRFSSDAEFTIKNEKDQLFIMMTGQQFYPIYPTGRDEFTYRAVKVRLSFIRNSKGKVDRFIMRQNGRDHKVLKTN